MLWNFPNILTMMRIALIPVFVGVFYLPDGYILGDINITKSRNTLAALIFALAGFTDWLDGFWARKFNQSSNFGAFLDPVADKLMVAAALIVLVELDRIGAVIALIIIGREIAVSALREWMAGVGDRGSVAVAQIGKIKTAAQM
jgi:CDP-diacylglycerol--glycerol-3-phosphate 3-phosphatidyltransferase/cardiolipin synthase